MVTVGFPNVAVYQSNPRHPGTGEHRNQHSRDNSYAHMASRETYQSDGQCRDSSPYRHKAESIAAVLD
jgi:hypothetical protein